MKTLYLFHHVFYFSTGKQHSSDFSRLIAQVRGHLETTKQTRIKQEVIVVEEHVEKTASAGTATFITFLKQKNIIKKE